MVQLLTDAEGHSLEREHIAVKWVPDLRIPAWSQICPALLYC